jgi:hypothetical protein
VPCGHAQVGQQLYERVPVYMRTQLWKSLLLHSDSAAKNRPAAAAAAAAAAAEPAAESADVKVFVATINRTLPTTSRVRHSFRHPFARLFVSRPTHARGRGFA